MKIDICRYLILFLLLNGKVRYTKTFFKVQLMLRPIKEFEWTGVKIFVPQRNVGILLCSISVFQTLIGELFLSKYLKHQTDFFFFWKIKLYNLILQ